MIRGACALAVTLVLAIVTSATATIHRWVDDDGVVHYADRLPLPSGAPGSAAPASVNTPTVPDEPPAARRPSAADSVPPAPAPPSPRAAASPSPPPTPIVELMRRLRLDQDAEHLATTARGVLHERALRSRHASALWRATNTAFSSEALLVTMGDRLTRTLGDSPLVPQMLAWLGSPLGLRLVDAASQPDTPARAAAFRRFAADLPDTAPVERIRLIREFGRVTDVVSVSVDAATRIERAVDRLVQLADSGRGARPDRRRAWGVDDLRWQSRMSLLFSLRDLPDDDVRAALAFYASPPGRALSRACRDALLNAIDVAETRAGDALGGTTPTSARR